MKRYPYLSANKNAAVHKAEVSIGISAKLFYDWLVEEDRHDPKGALYSWFTSMDLLYWLMRISQGNKVRPLGDAGDQNTKELWQKKLAGYTAAMPACITSPKGGQWWDTGYASVYKYVRFLCLSGVSTVTWARGAAIAGLKMILDEWHETEFFTTEELVPLYAFLAVLSNTLNRQDDMVFQYLEERKDMAQILDQSVADQLLHPIHALMYWSRLNRDAGNTDPQVSLANLLAKCLGDDLADMDDWVVDLPYTRQAMEEHVRAYWFTGVNWAVGEERLYLVKTLMTRPGLKAMDIYFTILTALRRNKEAENLYNVINDCSAWFFPNHFRAPYHNVAFQLANYH